MQKTIEITIERFEELKMAEVKHKFYKNLYKILVDEMKRLDVKIPDKALTD